jgi:hypothetical protein
MGPSVLNNYFVPTFILVSPNFLSIPMLWARRWIKDLPHIIRRQLQDVREFPEESLEKYAERAQELTTDGYPGTPDRFIQIVATDMVSFYFVGTTFSLDPSSCFS